VSTALLPILLLAVVFYFLILRPAQKRQREARETVARLEVGRTIMTTGGLFGTVTALEGDQVEVEIAPGVRVRYLMAAVAKVVPEEAPEAEQIGGAGPDIVLDPESPTGLRQEGDQNGR
jgi:preprotein translocase subunit YajC